MNSRIKNLKGLKFGKLSVISLGAMSDDGHAIWVCKCDCDMPWVMYNLLVGLGVSICTEDEMRAHMEGISAFYSPGITRRSESDRERDKAAFVWENSRKAALGAFYEKMKAGGAKSIFGIVGSSGLVESIVTNNKKQQ